MRSKQSGRWPISPALVDFSQSERGHTVCNSLIIHDFCFGKQSALPHIGGAERMKTKLMLLMVLAAGSMFARSRVSIGIGIGVPAYGYGYQDYGYAYYPPPPPPPPVYYAQPPYPGPGYTWVNGYYYP